MKLFISQPMNGKTADEIAAAREDALYLFKRALRSREIRGFGREEKVVVIDNYSTELDPIKALSESIAKMAEADIVLIPDTPRLPRGCEVEKTVAKGYNLPIYYYRVGALSDEDRMRKCELSVTNRLGDF